MNRTAQGAASLEDVDAVFAALGHEVRRHIVLLLSHLGGELPSGWLAARFPHSWPTTTHHLDVLESAGVIEVRREGRSSHYRLNRERLDNVLGGWMKNLTPPSPQKKWDPAGPRTSIGLAQRGVVSPKRKITKPKKARRS